MGNYLDRFCGGANSHTELDVYSLPAVSAGARAKPLVLFEGYIRIQKLERNPSKSFAQDASLKLQIEPSDATKIPESAEAAVEQPNLI